MNHEISYNGHELRNKGFCFDLLTYKRSLLYKFPIRFRTQNLQVQKQFLLKPGS